MIGKLFGAAVTLGAFAAFSAPASASLIFDETIFVTGQGFGNAHRLMVMQSVGSDPDDFESGCITVIAGALAQGCLADETNVFDANGVVNPGGDEASPLSDNQKFGIPTLGEAGLTDASQIRILFNSTEPGGNSINLIDLTLKFYDGDTLLFALDGGFNFPTSEPGNGSAGYVFVVSLDEQDDLNAAVFALPGFESFRVAVEATALDYAGGRIVPAARRAGQRHPGTRHDRPARSRPCRNRARAASQAVANTFVTEKGGPHRPPFFMPRQESS